MLVHSSPDPSPAKLVLNESTLAENTAFVPIKNELTAGYGGAIFVARNVELTVQGCRATSNTVEGDAGTKSQTMAGGFTSTCSSARVTLSDSHFVANQARLSTGTVRAVDSASISSCEITSAFGGAVYVVAQDLKDDAGLVLCSFIVDEYALLRIARSSFMRNLAGRDLQGLKKFKAAGGAIHSETHSAFLIVVEDSDISENRAVGGNAEGGAVWSDSRRLSIRSTVMRSNTARAFGGSSDSQ